ncbi:MAG TPA: hypothetical protein VMU94_28480 [Streptosporangiaceae bacterium]|nr:hypothetical protein [Streptosporangiaceae bacterium]
MPFDTGHVLALCVFPENDFSPYRTVWHRDPGGRWSIYVDGPRLDTGCPRYYGPACQYTGHAPADVLHRRLTSHPSTDWISAVRRARKSAQLAGSPEVGEGCWPGPPRAS